VVTLVSPYTGALQLGVHDVSFNSWTDKALFGFPSVDIGDSPWAYAQKTHLRMAVRTIALLVLVLSRTESATTAFLEHLTHAPPSSLFESDVFSALTSQPKNRIAELACNSSLLLKRRAIGVIMPRFANGPCSTPSFMHYSYR
jgi:hypothetical protein